MRNLRYKSKFVEMIFFLRKQFSDYDITWRFSKSGDYIIEINGFHIPITPELLEDKTLEQIHQYIVDCMNKDYPKRNKK